MKIVYSNRITAVTADKEESGFPDDNVLNEHPKSTWSSTDNIGTLTCQVQAFSNVVTVFNTNATEITVTVKDSTGSTIIQPAQEYDLSGITTLEEFMKGEGIPFINMWFDYDFSDEEIQVVIDFEAALGEKVSAGVVWIGEAISFKNPQYGFSEGRVDYSVIRELSNGATYIKNRDTVRVFAGTIQDTRGELYSLQRRLDEYVGANAAPWQITDQASDIWSVFGRMESQMNQTHSHPNNSTMEFNILEVL